MTKRRLVCCLGLLGLVNLQCGGGGDDGPPDATPINFDRAGMISHIGENVVIPTFEQFRDDADALSTAVAAYCAAVGTANEATALAEARSTWRAAMSSWQTAELMTFGPSNAVALRDVIYSWPVVSPCAVDQDVELMRTDSSYDIGSRLTNRRGLDALEYLLHTETLDTVCASQAAPPGWDQLPDATRVAARCDFLPVAAADLAAQAQVLVDAWKPGAGDYLAELKGAPERDALNAIFGALFYLDLRTKDVKLGAMSAADVESEHAHVSKENISANLLGFRRVFFGEDLSGADGLGFDDFLRAADAGAVADAISTDVIEAEASVAAIPGTLAEAVTGDVNAAMGAQTAVKDITDRLKNDVPATLGLEIPTEAGGDTD